MNQVSIIINGTRYDTSVVDQSEGYDAICEECDLLEDCNDDNFFHLCSSYLSENCVFKKSTKTFEP